MVGVHPAAGAQASALGHPTRKAEADRQWLVRRRSRSRATRPQQALGARVDGAERGDWRVKARTAGVAEVHSIVRVDAHHLSTVTIPLVASE